MKFNGYELGPIDKNGNPWEESIGAWLKSQETDLRDLSDDPEDKEFLKEFTIMIKLTGATNIPQADFSYRMIRRLTDLEKKVKNLDAWYGA